MGNPPDFGGIRGACFQRAGTHYPLDNVTYTLISYNGKVVKGIFHPLNEKRVEWGTLRTLGSADCTAAPEGVVVWATRPLRISFTDGMAGHPPFNRC